MALSFFRFIIGTLIVLGATLIWSLIAKDTRERFYLKLFISGGLWIVFVAWLAA